MSIYLSFISTCNERTSIQTYQQRDRPNISNISCRDDVLFIDLIYVCPSIFHKDHKFKQFWEDEFEITQKYIVQSIIIFRRAPSQILEMREICCVGYKLDFWSREEAALELHLADFHFESWGGGGNNIKEPSLVLNGRDKYCLQQLM